MAGYVGIFESTEAAKQLADELSKHEGIRAEEIGVFAPGDDTTTPRAKDLLSGIEKRAAAAMSEGDTVMVARAAFGLGRFIEEGLERAKPKRVFTKPKKYLQHVSDFIGLPILSPRRPMGYLPTGTITGAIPLSLKGHIDPVVPHLKKGLNDPVLPHLKKGLNDPVLPHLKKGTVDPVLPHLTKDRTHFSRILPLIWRSRR